MLSNVWTVDEFKDQSNKAFSRRSAQLQAIDRALGKAQTTDPKTEAGVTAILDVLNAIAEWRKFKGTKTSGRARAVDTLQSQLATVSESIYKRKIGQANMTSPWVENKAIKNQGQNSFGDVRNTLGQMMGQKPPVPPRPGMPPSRPQPPIPTPPPTRTAKEDRLFDVLAQAMITQRQRAMGYDDEDLFDDLDAKQKGRLTARWMLAVSDNVTDINAARGEALRIIGAMLGNDISVIKTLLSNNVEVVVVSRDEGMTVLKQFQELSGTDTFDGRSWDTVRGVGNVQNKGVKAMIGERKELNALKNSGKKGASIVAIDAVKGKIYTAVTEENLLGGLTTAPGAGCYATGYSTTTHEFAHSIHHYGLTPEDRTVIDRAYESRLRQPETQQWVDGPRKFNGQTCYAAMNSTEYFAQLSNAWLGVNMGTDPYTNQPRNNGKAWVNMNEPRDLCMLLERVYGQTSLDDLNPDVILKS